MEWIAVIIGLALMGALIGGLARLALPGPDPMSIGQTIGIGVLGSLIAGIAVSLATDGTHGAGFLASFAVTVLLVYLVRRSRGGRLDRPVGRGGTRVR